MEILRNLIRDSETTSYALKDYAGKVHQLVTDYFYSVRSLELRA